jgi:hypothetical protein
MNSERKNNGTLSGSSLRSVAAEEVARLRAMRSDLQAQRNTIDHELGTIEQLLKTLVSFDPSLRSPEDIHRPRARRLGLTLQQILEAKPNEWFSINDLEQLLAERLPVQVNETSLRNALYHLVKTRDQIESRETDQGIQYTFSESHS